MCDSDELKEDFGKFMALFVATLCVVGSCFLVRIAGNYSHGRPIKYGFVKEVTEKYDAEEYVKEHDKYIKNENSETKPNKTKDSEAVEGETPKNNDKTDLSPLYDTEGNIIGYVKS